MNEQQNKFRVIEFNITGCDPLNQINCTLSASMIYSTFPPC